MADSSTTIISRLASRLKNATDGRDMPDLYTRDIGGHFRKNQPYISGYFQVMFGLPGALFEQDDGSSSKWLHSTADSFTPHTQSITKIDIMGMGQIGSSYPANVMTTREFTTTHREFQNLPILNIIRRWAAVFDPFTGVSPLQGNKFYPPSYKGWCAVAQIKPTRSEGSPIAVEDLEECYVYQGVWPTNIPVDTAGQSDITANDSIQLSVTWSFDGAPMTSAEPGIADQVVSVFNNINPLTGSDGGTYEVYLNNAMKISPWQNLASDKLGSKVSP